MSSHCGLALIMHLRDLYITLPCNICRCFDLNSTHWLPGSCKHCLCYSCGATSPTNHDDVRLQGIIQHSTINNLSFGRSVDETVRTLQAVQYVQENPDEVCPAGWKPGDVTMKPDPKKSKEYFAAI